MGGDVLEHLQRGLKGNQPIWTEEVVLIQPAGTVETFSTSKQINIKIEDDTEISKVRADRDQGGDKLQTEKCRK